MKLNLSRLAQGDAESAQKWQQFLARGEEQRTAKLTTAAEANTARLKAMQEALEATRKDLADQQKAIEDDLTELNKQLVELEKKLRRVVKEALVLDQSGTAGGMIGAQLEGDEVSRGIPTCTGEIKFSTNAGVPSGWLECDGSYKAITVYPELYSCIGNHFDTARPMADAAGLFKLPNSADLPGAGAFVWGVWLIRT